MKLCFMTKDELVDLLLKSGIVTQEPNDTFRISGELLTEYGKFVIQNEINRCPNCGKVDHEDGGCNV